MMFTRCPACETAFRVTAEQLKARAGKVRCGQCDHVFNALENLGAMPDEEPRAPEAPAPVGAGEAVAVAAPALVADVAPPAPEESVAPVQAGLPALTAAEIAGKPAPGAPEEFEEFEAPAPPPRWRPVAWTLGVTLLLALLGAQAAYVFRVELAAAQPELRPTLEEMCTSLGCEVPLPRMAELVSIEASDLHPDPKRGGLLVLAATLKNRAPFVQDYPHLELSLTDTRDQPLVRRVLAPADYLAPGAEARAGFPANGDLAVNLWLDAAGVGATGYRLYLFYP